MVVLLALGWTFSRTSWAGVLALVAYALPPISRQANELIEHLPVDGLPTTGGSPVTGGWDAAPARAMMAALTERARW